MIMKLKLWDGPFQGPVHTFIFIIVKHFIKEDPQILSAPHPQNLYLLWHKIAYTHDSIFTMENLSKNRITNIYATHSSTHSS